MQAIFVKQFLPLQVSHWFVLHKIVFINITAEEKPETKGKKVMGVGLGNIFEGGPIKLRSTAASAKRPVEKVSGSKYPHCQEIQCKKRLTYDAAPYLGMKPIQPKLQDYSIICCSLDTIDKNCD